MKNRWVQVITGICVVLLLSGGIVYMMKDQKHQRAKKRYDAYTAQLDAYIEKHGIPNYRKNPQNMQHFMIRFLKQKHIWRNMHRIY